MMNGLCQGCTIAPTLFILYLELAIQCWRSYCQAIGIEVQYQIGGKLVGERTRRPLSFTVSECLFANDAALICSSREHMDVAAKVFEEVSAGWGLTLSVPKTKLLVASVGLSPNDVAPLQMNGGIVEVLNEFQYLGSLVEAAGGMTGEIEHHIVWASRTFGSLCNAVFMDHHLTLETKRLVYRSVVLGVLFLVQKLGLPPRYWLKNWSGFIVIVCVVLWALGGLYSGQNTSPLPS